MTNQKIKKDIPFSGKLMTAEPSVLGTNFRTLTNLRYTDTHVKDVAGMTKINSSAMNATYFKTRSAFHFKKSQPAESHVLVQAYSSALDASQVLDNTAAIPATGAFSATALLTDSAGSGTGRFCDAPDGQVIYCNGVDNQMWSGAEGRVGAVIKITTALSAISDSPAGPKDYTEEMQNTKATDKFAVGDTYKTFLVGSPRPIKGVKIYIATANTSANTLVVKESTNGAWTALTVTSDGTSVGGASLAQTGTISWASTVATTKPRYLCGYYLYWYQFTLDVCTAEIYQITLDIPFQPIIDLWDGVYRDVTRFYTSVHNDHTTKVLMEDYDASSAETYFDASSITSAEPIEVGFLEKMTGLYFVIPGGYENTNAVVTTIDYWDGGTWVTVGTVSDGTSDGTNSLTSSGAITWSNADIIYERKRSLYNQVPLYYYRISFSATLDAALRFDYVAGISASKTISHYKFPVFAQGRVFLCSDTSGEKNKALISSKYMPQSFNGADSIEVYFGEEGELTCGTELFSQYGSSLYSLVLMFKNTETWVMAGQDITQWENNTFLLSSSIGCPAPLTLKTINLRAEPGAGVNRALAMWQAANGVYMSDGRAPIPVHGDIDAYFDNEDSRCILDSKIGDSVAFMDEDKQEYHLLVASGSTATSLNTELVYDIKRNKWFEIDRTADLQCGVAVHDTDGNAYAYGFLDTGYMERLENGTTFDGTDIVATVQFGDIPLGGFDVETRITDVTLFTVAHTNDITCTHYGDTSSTGTAKTMDHTSTNRLAMPEFDEKLDGYFHSLKYSTTGPFEPIATVIWGHSL